MSPNDLGEGLHMKKTNLLILFVWRHFVGMERLNHINGDILDGLLQVGRV